MKWYFVEMSIIFCVHIVVQNVNKKHVKTLATLQALFFFFSLCFLLVHDLGQKFYLVFPSMYVVICHDSLTLELPNASDFELERWLHMSLLEVTD
jgi:hypothetical protein